MARLRFDVVVIGSGLAGISAALSARELGASVALVSSGPVPNGSSFSDNTWGLGMVTDAPRSEKDDIRGHRSLFKALKNVGMGVCTPQLAERLCCDGEQSLEWLVRQGARFTYPKDANQREFVPCFDTQTRTWRGFLSHDSKHALVERLHQMGVTVIDQCELLALLGSPGCVKGILTLHKMSEPLFISASATILATGGLAGLYKSHISPSTCANGHFCALEAGTSLVNVEFQQLMMGYLSPLHGVVFNEKLWRWVDLVEKTGPSTFAPLSNSDVSAAQEAHSWHGPFTCERPSALVERIVCTSRPGSVFAQIRQDAVSDDAPQLIADYAEWLTSSRGIDITQPLPLALFAHSSNGGIAIDEQGFTGIEGLYAAGEAAGGVHGADRIGGLASVSAVVFGRKAGLAAASCTATNHSDAYERLLSRLWRADCDAPALRGTLSQAMDDHALANRNARGLSHALDLVRDVRSELQDNARDVDLQALSSQGWQEVLATRQCLSAATLCEAMLTSMSLRKESRGSHMREDFPQHEPLLEHQIALYLTPDGSVRAPEGEQGAN